MSRGIMLSRWAGLAGLALLAASAQGQTPLGSIFTYQGRLEQGGAPVTGASDLRFSLWTLEAGGAQVGSTINLVAAPEAGMFTVELDFGAAAFNGDERWLQIAVRSPAGTGAYTQLTPRQPVNAAPYAVQTRGIYVDATEQVGIGTTAPQRPLHVAGEAGVMALEGTTHAFIDFYPDGYAAGRKAYLGYPGANINSLVLRNQIDGGHILLGLTNGNVGIGMVDTALPTAKLHVNGSTATTSLNVNQATTTATLNVSGAATAASLSVSGAASSDTLTVDDTTTTERLVANDEVVLPAGVIRQGGAAPATNDLGLYALDGHNMRLVTNNTDILFFTNSAPGSAAAAPANSAKMRITAAGNVGIGIDDPVDKFEVAGAARFDTLFIDAGSDLAESYDVAPAYDGRRAITADAGLVVSIDPTTIGKLVISSSAYDRRVAGVISGAGGVAPGMVLNHAGTVADGDHPVANVGRVWCWVDAEAGGAIEAGDLLTTSPTPGHAMKVEDWERAPGATIGKAMSPLKEGRGLVLVLVSLQ